MRRGSRFENRRDHCARNGGRHGRRRTRRARDPGRPDRRSLRRDLLGRALFFARRGFRSRRARHPFKSRCRDGESRFLSEGKPLRAFRVALLGRVSPRPPRRGRRSRRSAGVAEIVAPTRRWRFRRRIPAATASRRSSTGRIAKASPSRSRSPFATTSISRASGAGARPRTTSHAARSSSASSTAESRAAEGDRRCERRSSETRCLCE